MRISPLLMSVLYLYISSKYGADGLNAKRILMPDSPISDDEYAYPFPDSPTLADGEAVQGNAPKRVYSLDSAAFDGQGLYAYHLHVPQSAMMGVANPSNESPVSFLSVMLFRALCALDEKLDGSVVAHV